jgi:hypothetical protein
LQRQATRKAPHDHARRERLVVLFDLERDSRALGELCELAAESCPEEHRRPVGHVVHGKDLGTVTANDGDAADLLARQQIPALVVAQDLHRHVLTR